MSLTQLNLFRCQQSFDQPKVQDIESTCHQSLQECGVSIGKQKRICIAVGSRGIAGISRITRTVVDWVKNQGAIPFIIPAMGSHGGASSLGQVSILHSYGISEESMGCSILSSMETVRMDISSQGLGVPVYLAKDAEESDGIILINRIKPHTDFHGKYESGLMKMAVIGLGKQKQATIMHQHGVHGLKILTPEVGQLIIESGKVILGLGIVENAYDETAYIRAIPGFKIPEEEPGLLELARKNMPSLPIDNLDVLLVDRLGKNISGTGMDTNIIGRIYIPGQDEPSSPNIHSIIVSDLTQESGGNATGMGLADIITEKFQSKINYHATKQNIITSGFLLRAKMPFVAENELSAIEMALRAAGCVDVSKTRFIRIKDTLHLSEFWASQEVVDEIQHQPNVQILEKIPRWTNSTEGIKDL